MKRVPKGDNERSEGFSRWVAFVLDDVVRVPGTKRRFGLDPLIGLIPGVGDFLASGAGLTILAAAARRKMPIRIYIKMFANWALNALVGTVPVAGDLFSFWFKSNRRNYGMLHAHLQSQGDQKERGGWWPMIVLGILALVVFAMVVAIVATLWRWIMS